MWRERGIRAWGEGWWEMPMLVGDQVGRIVGAPAGLDGDAPERRRRGGRRPQLLPPDRPDAQPRRLRARQLPVGALPLPGPARARGRRVRGRARRSSTRSTSARCSSRSATCSSRPAEIQDVEPIVRRAHEVGAHVILDCYQSAGIVPARRRPRSASTSRSAARSSGCAAARGTAGSTSAPTSPSGSSRPSPAGRPTSRRSASRRRCATRAGPPASSPAPRTSRRTSPRPRATT